MVKKHILKPISLNPQGLSLSLAQCKGVDTTVLTGESLLMTPHSTTAPADAAPQPADSTITYSCISYGDELLLLISTDQGLREITFVATQAAAQEYLDSAYAPYSRKQDHHVRHQQVEQHLQHKNPVGHSLKLDLQGTAFQQQVWSVLTQIPYGHVATYAQIAEAIGKPKAYRAVGTAIGKNPLALYIPCHRVIQSNGRLGGYRWGIGRKQNLLINDAHHP